MNQAKANEEYTSLGAALKDAYAKRDCVDLPTHSDSTKFVVDTEKELGFYEEGDDEMLIAIMKAGNASGDVSVRVEDGELVISFVTTPEFIGELDKVVKTTDGRFELSVADVKGSSLVTVKKVKKSSYYGQEEAIDGVHICNKKEEKMNQRSGNKKHNNSREWGGEQPSGYDKQNYAEALKAAASAAEALKSTHEGYEKALKDKDAEHNELLARFSKNISEHRQQMSAQTAKQATALKYGAAVVVGVGVGIAATLIYNNYVKK